MRAIVIGVMAWLLWVCAVPAQDLSALARLDPAASSVTEADGGIAVTLALSQPVPWRVRVLDGPPRLVMDFREVDFAPLARVAQTSPHVLTLRAGQFRPGWSRLVMQMDGPFLPLRAGMTTGGGGATVQVVLAPASPAAFAEKAALPEPPGWAAPKPADVPRAPVRGAGPLVVVLDPGHGGIDPGAERDGQSEAHLMLAFARELKEVLLRDGGFSVVMTRDEDVFVPLETRISIARKAGASVFVALHADALAEGEAAGATIYTLSDEATDAAARALAERHDRDDLLAGIDLSGQDDLVTTVLIDMARAETAPRVERLSIALETAIKGAGLKMHRHARQSGGFSVLKSPDIPSVLIEVGFLSSPGDLARLTDPKWRTKMADAIRDGLKAWAKEDAALAGAGK
ncbi:MAG: N-acetylmuramoyl-L-alanine amidase [Paracoccaceae bacterium]